MNFFSDPSTKANVLLLEDRNLDFSFLQLQCLQYWLLLNSFVDYMNRNKKIGIQVLNCVPKTMPHAQFRQ